MEFMLPVEGQNVLKELANIIPSIFLERDYLVILEGYCALNIDLGPVTRL